MGYTNDETLVQTSVWLKASDVEKLSELARNDGRKMSGLIRKIVSDYVEQEP